MMDVTEAFKYVEDNLAETFETPYEQYHEHAGKKFSLLGRLTTAEADEECLPIWRAQLETGEIIQVLPEEILNTHWFKQVI